MRHSFLKNISLFVLKRLFGDKQPLCFFIGGAILLLPAFESVAATQSVPAFKAQANSLKVTWLGTTCINISDGETSLLFDPYFSRQSMWKVITAQNLHSDPKLVKEWLGKLDKENIKSIFISHSHFDHVLDMVEAAKQLGATVYGSQSTKNIAIGGEVAADKIKLIKVGNEFTVGKFKILVLPGKHPPQALGISFFSGKIKEPLKAPASAYSYNVGENLNFFIQHPLGNILFHSSSETGLDKLDVSLSADLVIQGIPNRKSTEDLIDNVFKPTAAKMVMPVHIDDFFLPLKDGYKELSRANLKEFKETLSKNASAIQLVMPKYAEPFFYKSSKIEK